MNCENCEAKFSAACYQPTPGGTSAPGEFLALASILAFIALVLWLFDLTSAAVVVAIISIFPILKLPMAYFDCRGDAGYGDHKGVSCPECKHVNKIRLWSL